MASRARTNKGTKDLPWPELVRERIRAGGIEGRLTQHVLGTIELSPTQVQAAGILLRKILPDLSATELSGEVDTRPKVISGQPMTSSEWEQRYASDLASTSPAPLTNGNGKVS